MPDNDALFVGRIVESGWFKGEVVLTRTPLWPVRVRWPCPVDGCSGEMKINGFVWPTIPEGYHHTCTICGFTAAISGKRYPAVEYEEVPHV